MNGALCHSGQNRSDLEGLDKKAKPPVQLRQKFLVHNKKTSMEATTSFGGSFFAGT
ncbi:hypothetical protein G159_13565 [Planococcus glaciei CHR43]|uniref:hypothetical protein n=1 Tax=Planococcus glaciei TaxID=459472 RepID=UPI0003DF3D7E|nr:hypothetical protein [Planococcus glaciei]ETP68232.1 hypothetical protein G159_13565 [Planococcus glaciei CHR43]